MKKKIWRAAVVLALLLCAFCLPQTARASYNTQVPDMEKLAALTLEYGYAGVEFRVYRAGDLSQNVIITPGGDFAAYPVNFEGLDSAGWRAMAETLAGYAARDALTPRAVGVTDAEGRVRFEGLEVGLYLVVGDKIASPSVNEETGLETTTYVTPQPFLICLPNWQTGVDTEWNYDVAVAPKFELSEEETVIRRALKVWRDGTGVNRPRQITVQLLRDGELFDTVELSADNNWRYQWDALDNQYDWQLVEQGGGPVYEVSVSLQGITFVVTNTQPGNTTTTDEGNDPPPDPKDPPDDPPPEDPPGDPETPPNIPPNPDEDIPDPGVPLTTTDVPEDPEEPKYPEEPDGEDIPDPDVPLARLPQTGQLWWPVPLLVMGGLFCLLLGGVLRRRAGYEEE